MPIFKNWITGKRVMSSTKIGITERGMRLGGILKSSRAIF